MDSRWPDENILTRAEVTEQLADVEGMAVEEFAREAEEFHIEPPSEADAVVDGEE